MYTDRENWAEIRRRVLVDGLGKRAACREYDIALGHAHQDPPPSLIRLDPHDHTTTALPIHPADLIRPAPAPDRE